MTVETIGWQAQRKGMDVLGTGDCLQPEWRRALRANLVEAEPGWFALRDEIAERIARKLPPNLRGAPRFVLSTEVSCTRPQPGRLRGLHVLVYFPSFDSAERFAAKVAGRGDLTEGRPELALTPRELLEMVRMHDSDSHLAPAHVMNPYFSGFGVVEGHARLEGVFGADAGGILAVETGLTSTPAMCRRLPSLDELALFSNSDAHSPENIGRECTMLESEPGYRPMCAALRAGRGGGVLGTLKFPLVRTRYHQNRCAACERSFDGERCPQCGGRLVTGSRDRLEQIAGRAEPLASPLDPPFRELLPLKMLLAEVLGAPAKGRMVAEFYERLLREVGHERFLLTKARAEELERVAPPQMARRILEQRKAGHDFHVRHAPSPEPAGEQPSLF